MHLDGFAARELGKERGERCFDGSIVRLFDGSGSSQIGRISKMSIAHQNIRGDGTADGAEGRSRRVAFAESA